MRNSWRCPFVIGSAARLAYGAGAMLAPEWMAEHLAPTLQGLADPRMNLRGFGGAHTAIAVYTLAGARNADRARMVLALNVMADALDAGVSFLEWRARGKVDPVVAGGVAINLAGLLCWGTAETALRRSP